ncbi:putative cyclin-L1-like protein, partial [Teratosphaeria destructans]
RHTRPGLSTSIHDRARLYIILAYQHGDSSLPINNQPTPHLTQLRALILVSLYTNFLSDLAISVPGPMAPIVVVTPSHLVNPAATSSQLETSSSQLDGVPRDVEDAVRYHTASLIQAAGILLRLPQDIIAAAIVTLQRFWVGPDGGSVLEHDAQDTAAAALYLAAKPSGHTVHPRQLLTAFTYLHSVYPDFRSAADGTLDPQWQLPEGQYEVARDRLYEIEAQILRVLGFQTHVALPYSLCINYLQTLDVFQHDRPTGSRLARRAFKHLNGALLSPQLLYLTHQPPSLATAAIYLAARELDVKLPEGEWWEVFDVDREELGFLVVALQSLEGFVREDRREWGRRKVPLTAEGLRSELERRRMLEEGL